MNTKSIVEIVMGSDSDLHVMKDAAQVLEKFSICYNITIVSAHRTPDRLYTYASEVINRGIKVIIAGAGGSAHLPGMIASITSLPVIGVPIKTGFNDGLDSLLSIVQMPKGIPVATVAVNGAFNAGILACQILATSDYDLLSRIQKYKEELQNQVLSKVKELENIGWKSYLDKSSLGNK